jgi:CIC family chloride channel protein
MSNANRKGLWRWISLHIQPSDALLMFGAALVIGLATGAGVWLFKQAIVVIQQGLFTDLGGAIQHYFHWGIIFVSALGGLFVGLIAYFFIKEERHAGVAGIMEAEALAGGRLRYKRMPLKVFLSALSIGSGGSVGPEDPSVQIGANLGSMFGQWLRLSDERVRALVAAGAAGGIAAAFNAPIAGVFFALEIVLGEIGGTSLGAVLLAAVASAALTQAITGAEPAFHVPAYALKSAFELPLYLLLGVLAGPIAAAYIRLVYLLQDMIAKFQAPRWIKPAISGLILGIIGLFLPQVLGTGYPAIELTLNGTQLTILFLLLLLTFKLVLTPLSLASGFTGGLLAPSLFLGAMLGALYAHVMHLLIPGLALDFPAYAMVGMAAVLAGALHAPLTAVILLFEMTNDYQIILPLMITVVTAMIVTQRLERESVYTMALIRKGIRLERGRDVEVLDRIAVREVMREDTVTVHESEPLVKASELFISTRRHGIMVMDTQNRLVGMLTLTDLDKYPVEKWSEIKVGEACTRNLFNAYPDETLSQALRRMSTADVGRLPVVSPEDPTHLVGVIRREDVVRAYSLALTRRSAMHHRAYQVRLGAFADVDVEEVEVRRGSPLAGKRVREITWPHESVVASLRRRGEVIIPHGDTILNAGDLLLIVAEGDAREEVKKMCQVREVYQPVDPQE